MSRLFLVRHGAVENPRCLRYGCLPGFGLSRAGQRQASASGDHLASLGLRSPLLVCSPLERAQETASIVAGRMGLGAPTIEPGLIEIGSRYDGLPRKMAPGPYLARRFDPEFHGRDESLPQVAARMAAAIRQHQQSHMGDLIAVSHQLPIRATLLALTQGLAALEGLLPPMLLLRLRQPLDPGYACVIALAPAGPERWLVDRVFTPPQGDAPSLAPQA